MACFFADDAFSYPIHLMSHSREDPHRHSESAFTNADTISRGFPVHTGNQQDPNIFPEILMSGMLSQRIAVSRIWLMNQQLVVFLTDFWFLMTTRITSFLHVPRILHRIRMVCKSERMQQMREFIYTFFVVC
jgi:hypothetical protein